MWIDDLIQEYKDELVHQRMKRAYTLQADTKKLLNVDIDPTCGVYMFEEDKGIALGQRVNGDACLLFFKRVGAEFFFSEPISTRLEAGRELLNHGRWTYPRVKGGTFNADYNYLQGADDVV